MPPAGFGRDWAERPFFAAIIFSTRFQSGWSKRMIWGRYASFTWGPVLMRPSSGYSSPTIILIRVDFPVPLSPMRAMRSPPSTFRLMPSKRCLSP